MAFKVNDLRARLRRRLSGRSNEPAGGRTRRAAGDLTVAAPKVQQDFWCLDQLAPQQGLANVSRAWRIEGDFDPKRCRQALIALTQKHDCLRMALFAQAGLLQMRVSEEKAVDFVETDLRQHPQGPGSDLLVEAILAREGQRSFDTGRDPLLRLRAYQIANQAWVLLLVYHHAIMDGWSVGQFCQELGQCYDALTETGVIGESAAGATAQERPVFDFADHALELAKRGPPTPGPQDLALVSRAQPPLPELALPFDFAAPTAPSFEGNSTPVQIDTQSWSTLEALAARLHVSPVSVLLAAFRLSVSAISDQREICIGTTAMTRDGPGLQGMLGAFVQTLPIRTPLIEGADFAQLCQAEQAALTQGLVQGRALAHQASSAFAGHTPASHDTFQVVLNHRGFSTRSLSFAGCTSQPLAQAGRATPFALALNLERSTGGAEGELLWNAERFSAATAARMVQHFTATLKGALQNPKAPFDSLLQDGSATAEASRLLSCPAVTPSPLVGDLLATAFAQHREKSALRCGDLHWSYADLEQESAAWTRAILSAPGSAGDLVALALPRGAGFVAALIGILRAGRAFVPVSVLDPPERIRRILQQAEPKHLIAQEDLAQALGMPALSLGDVGNMASANSQGIQEGAPEGLAAEDLAYVMFTSGSTGEPKGVAIPHRALANHLSGVRQVFAAGPGERMLSCSAITFDSIIYEVLLPLVTGGELIMIEETLRRDPWHILQVMAATAPQHFFATPSLWRMLIEAGLPLMPQLKALVGGEVVRPDLVAKIRPKVGRLFNVYGPTEATVFSTWQEIPSQMPDEGEKRPLGSQIGQPFPGYSLAVMDPRGRPVWPGMLGEIWISGAGLATGYFNSPERTEQSFLSANQPGQAARWYRTGDRGRLGGDGTISCAGRMDDQLKISGQRIEPGEIENLLLASGLTTGAAVFATEIAGKTILSALYVPQGEASEPRVRRYLQSNLPSAWVPGLIAPCAALPVTASGKMDRRALVLRAKEIFASCENLADQDAGLQADLAPAIRDGWQQVLGQAPTGLDQDFFAAGGNSLLLITLLARIRERTSCHLPVATAFGEPTPRGLQALLAKTPPQDLHQALVSAKEGSGSEPLVFLPGLVPSGPNLTMMMQQAPEGLGCYVVQRPVAPAQGSDRSFVDQARYFARVLDHGFPNTKLHLAGFSYGGAEAFETARQLVELNSPPASVCVVDNGPVFRKLGAPDTSWGEQGVRAEALRRDHLLEPLEGDMRLVRGDRHNLLSLAMIGYGWEDFVQGEVGVYLVAAHHDALLHDRAKQTMQALLAKRPPDCIVTPQPGATERRRVSHLLATNQPKAALDLLRASCRAHPNHAWSALVADNLATDLEEEGKDLLADWLAGQATVPPKGVPWLAWHAARAQALLRLDDPEAALREIEAARAAARPTAGLIRDLEVCYGYWLLQLGRVPEAIEVLEQVGGHCGYRADIWAYLGICFAKQQQFQRALPLLQAAQNGPLATAEIQSWFDITDQAIRAGAKD
ncbi:MAG: hypothetical protein BM558_05720 [Roseobacter sp. MedPE-SW]|nr:MAG: hypothetical protein BM558_05720 [Roseobacter sp. MedPE-SW]